MTKFSARLYARIVAASACLIVLAACSGAPPSSETPQTIPSDGPPAAKPSPEGPVVTETKPSPAESPAEVALARCEKENPRPPFLSEDDLTAAVTKAIKAKSPRQMRQLASVCRFRIDCGSKWTEKSPDADRVLRWLVSVSGDMKFRAAETDDGVMEIPSVKYPEDVTYSLCIDKIGDDWQWTGASRIPRLEESDLPK